MTSDGHALLLVFLSLLFLYPVGQSYSLRGGGNAHSKIQRYGESHILRRLVALGGTCNGELALSSVETLVWDAPCGKGVVREWRPENHSMLELRDSPAAVAVNERVYVLGGYNGSHELSSVETRYFAKVSAGDARDSLETWSTAPWMRKRRCNLGAALVQGRGIYVVGGFNGTHDLPNTEFLRLDDNGMASGGWEWGPSMLQKRSGPAVVSLRGKVYAFGGFDGESLTATAEEMDHDRWVHFPSMPLGVRGGAAAVAVGGRLFVIGGAAKDARLARVESVDPREGRWVSEPSLNVPRAGVAAIGIENNLQICAVGGYDGNNVLRSAETFDVRMRGSWLFEPDMVTPRWGGAVVMLCHNIG